MYNEASVTVCTAGTSSKCKFVLYRPNCHLVLYYLSYVALVVQVPTNRLLGEVPLYIYPYVYVRLAMQKLTYTCMEYDNRPNTPVKM